MIFLILNEFLPMVSMCCCNPSISTSSHFVILAIVPTNLGEFQPLQNFFHQSNIHQTDHHLAYNHQLIACNEAQRFEVEVPV